MPMLDVFRSDLFGVTALTTAINKLPFVPNRIDEMGLFSTKSVTTTTVVVEERLGKLMIVPTAARGAMPNVASNAKRKARSFVVPHIPLNDSIKADDVQGVRAFGSETELETVAGLVNDKLAYMKTDLEATKEWHRIGALQGTVLDADGSTVVYDFFDEFGITQQAYAIDFTQGGDNSSSLDENSVKGTMMTVKRYIQDTLGMSRYSDITVLCGDQFYDTLVLCPEVRKAYDRYQESAFFRANQARTIGGFEYADVTWENYRGKVGSTHFIPTQLAIAFPTGVQDLFQSIYAPADFIETVNTVGKPYYAKQKVQDWDTGIDMHVQTNPLMICTRPAVLIKLYDVNAGS